MTAKNQSAIESVCLLDVQAVEVNWLWEGRIPFGVITKIEGDPGAGKGTITIDLASRASTGRPMPLSALAHEPFSVLLLTTAEDDLAATIKPRLLAAGADCARVHAVTNLPTIPDDLPALREAILEQQIRLVVVDPLNAYLSGSVNGFKDQDIRRALSPLKQIAEETGAAVVLVHHLNKSESGNALYRGGGSIGISGAARSVLLAAPNPNDKTQRVLARVKGNLSAPPPSLGYRIVTAPNYDVPIIDWDGVVNLDADQLLTQPRASAEPGRQAEAETFLREILADGPRSSAEVDALTEKRSLSRRTVTNARKSIGAYANKRTDGWWVSLPAQSIPSDDTLLEPPASLPPCALTPTLNVKTKEERKDATAQQRKTIEANASRSEPFLRVASEVDAYKEGLFE